jgi:hypothetical protein
MPGTLKWITLILLLVGPALSAAREHPPALEQCRIDADSEQSNRYQNFLIRHDLWKQFVAEGATGAR